MGGRATGVDSAPRCLSRDTKLCWGIKKVVHKCVRHDLLREGLPTGRLVVNWYRERDTLSLIIISSYGKISAFNDEG